jgi:hypothetical protein
MLALVLLLTEMCKGITVSFDEKRVVVNQLLSPLPTDKLCKMVTGMYNLAKAFEAILALRPDFNIKALLDLRKKLTIKQYKALMWMNGKLIQTNVR